MKNIGGLQVHVGECLHGELQIVGGGVPLPFTVVRGKQSGATLLITAGVHCAEYVGIQAAMELEHELEPSDIRGCIIIVPLVCRNGFEQRSMSVVHEDKLNLNRIFPGNPGGSMGERIAWTITETLLKQADYYIDLHGGDGFEELTPYVYAPTACAPEVARIAQGMAMQVDVPYLVKSTVASGGAYNFAAGMGIPSVLLERGCAGQWSRNEVEATKKDVRNVLRHLGFLSDAKVAKADIPADVGMMNYIEAEHTGCWYPEKRAGDLVCTGEILGSLRDYQGTLLQTITASWNGVLLYQTISLNVLQGDVAVAYSERPREM